MEHEGAGCVTHIWTTISSRDPFHLRKLVLRMYWDGSNSPQRRGAGGRLFRPRTRPENLLRLPAPAVLRSRSELLVSHALCPPRQDHRHQRDAGRGHLLLLRRLRDMRPRWRTKPPSGASTPSGGARTLPPCEPDSWTERNGQRHRLNTTGRDNYLVLEAEGRGHYVGCHIDVDLPAPGWWGEGDDMFFIDGEAWPPRLHGTGTEDYFCGLELQRPAPDLRRPLLRLPFQDQCRLHRQALPISLPRRRPHPLQEEPGLFYRAWPRQ